MNLYLRLLLVALSARWRPRLSPFDESVLRFRVLPSDVDFWGHMNNGRYLTLTDLGRLDLFVRTGTFAFVRQRKWVLPIGSLMMRFRRPLRLLQSYQLRTRLLGWDDKWFFMESRFTRGDKEIARGVVRGLARGKEGNVPPSTILAHLGVEDPSPSLPEDVGAWLAEHK